MANWYARGPKGDQGIQGIQGVKGDKGDTGNTGSQGAQGVKGDKGDKGDTGNTGSAGPANSLSVGSVSNGVSPDVTISGSSPSQVLNFVFQKGDKGDTGDTGETGPQGIQGIQGEQGIQGVKGDKGDKGDPGDVSEAELAAAVSAGIASVVDGSPGALDTLNELAAALGDDPNFATTVSTNLGNKADNTRTISAGTGLTGGGDLTANRTLAVDFGSGAGKVTEGNDSRLTDSRTPTNGSVTTAKIADDAVTADKIADATIVDGNISASAGIVKGKMSSGVQASIGLADNSVQKVTTPMILYGTDGSGEPGLSFLAYGQTNGDDQYTVPFRDADGRMQSAAGATGLDVVNFAQLASAQLVAINAQTGTTYTLALSDINKAVECANASAITLTVPTNASVAFPIGTVIEVVQTGAGAITLAGSGVTINGKTGTTAQWSVLVLRKRNTNTWLAA